MRGDVRVRRGQVGRADGAGRMRARAAGGGRRAARRALPARAAPALALQQAPLYLRLQGYYFSFL